jgi:two-component system KDP operon response regulator KdpE
MAATLWLNSPSARKLAMTNIPAPIRILVVDDEPAIRRALSMCLSTQGYSVSTVDSGHAAHAFIDQLLPDLIVLDLGLPDMGGLEIIRSLRGEGVFVPIVVLSSRSDEAGKIKAFDLGADDYVTKPFGIDELLARVRTAIRHGVQERGEKPIFKSGDLTMDLVRRVVTVRGEEVKLTPREYALLRLLVAHAGKVLVHNVIQEEVWGGEVEKAYLRMCIRALRRKIEVDPNRPKLILTESGIGYRLRSPD